MIYDPRECAVFFRVREQYGHLSNMGFASDKDGLTAEWLKLEARKNWELCAVDPQGRYIFKQEDKWYGGNGDM